MARRAVNGIHSDHVRAKLQTMAHPLYFLEKYEPRPCWSLVVFIQHRWLQYHRRPLHNAIAIGEYLASFVVIV
jgi:hypothetical protein